MNEIEVVFPNELNVRTYVMKCSLVGQMLILQKLRGKKNTVGKGAKMPYVNNSEFGKYTARRHRRRHIHFCASDHSWISLFIKTFSTSDTKQFIMKFCFCPYQNAAFVLENEEDNE